ncbi:MAG: glycosyltransferase family A protein [Pseudohongiella sp.]|uniref:glycosyltransferase family 2 protein n=1 Tax=Pseudohongiella sp. TaxID=1979412 RepID=UPI0034A04B40
MSRHTVSVIIPFHSQDLEFLKEAVNSIEVENGALIIIVDDASPTSPRLSDFTQQKNNSILIHKLSENVGPGHARSIGLSFAQTPYISFLDADDAYQPGYLDYAVTLLYERSEIGIVCFPAEYVDLNGQPLEVKAISTEGYYQAADLVANRFLLQSSVGRESVMRSVIFSNRLRGEDHEYFYRLSQSGQLILHSHGARIYHRCGGTQSITRSNVRKDLEDRRNVMLDLWCHEDSGRHYLNKLFGERAIGLILLAICEGHSNLLEEIIEILKSHIEKHHNFELPTIYGRTEIEGKANFFAAKQFGRKLKPCLDKKASSQCFARFIMFCNDHLRPLYYEGISMFFNNLGHVDVVNDAKEILFSCAARIEIHRFHTKNSLALVLQAREVESKFQVWTTSNDDLPVDLLNSSTFINVVFNNKVLKIKTGLLMGSCIARSLMLSEFTRGGDPISTKSTFGGWRIYDECS